MEKKAHLLVVDDQPEFLLILEALLSDYYHVHTVSNGQEAINFLKSNPHPDLILLDVVMPLLNGFEVCKYIKTTPELQEIPVIFLTSLDSKADEEFGLTLGAADFIHKPFSPAVVLARVRNHLNLSRASHMLKLRNEDLEHIVAERTREVLRQSMELAQRNQEIIASQSATIMAFCSLAEARDNETGNHIRRTQQYVKALAESLQNHPRFKDELSDKAISLIFKSAPLHDIGKVGIPDSILMKPGSLNDEEWVIMKRHCQFGHDAIILAEKELEGITGSFLAYAREIAYCHHERWNGSGYPQRLEADDIPVSARLMSIADVYDALISKRVYKPAFPHEQAVAMIVAEKGKHFDPDMIDALIKITDTFKSIALRYKDEGQFN